MMVFLDLKADLAVTTERHHSFDSRIKILTKTTDGKPPEPSTPQKKDVLEMGKNRTNITMSSNSVVTPLSRTNSSSNPMTPSARISALNIVSDLLRKVGVSRKFFSYLSCVHLHCDTVMSIVPSSLETSIQEEGVASFCS